MSKHKMLQTRLVNKIMALDKERWRIFGDWLKSERESANLSQDGLADLIKVDRQTIYRLENALSGTKRETVIALAKALEVDLDIALNKAGFAEQKSEKHKQSHLDGFVQALAKSGIVKFSIPGVNLTRLSPEELAQLLSMVDVTVTVELKKVA